jgi:iron complex outermembrane receptor protein
LQCIQILPHPIFGAAYAPACAATNANGIRHTRLNAALSGHQNTFVASSTLAWDLGGSGAIDDVTIKAITGYEWSRSYRATEYDGTVLDGISSFELDKQTHQVSGELQILGTAFDEKLNFVFGAYADRERTPGTGRRPVRIYPSLEPRRILSSLEAVKLRNQSKAVYSQMTLDVNDIVSVTGGIRYTDDTKGFSAQRCFTRAAEPLACVSAYTTNGIFTRQSKTWTPMASLQLNAPQSWTGNGVLDKAMAYFTWSRGFKSGGYNGNGDTAAGTLTSFEPERVRNYEVGVKFSMFDRRLVGTVSRYDMSYTNIQLNVLSVNPETQVPTTAVFNAGAAKIQGIEIELQTLLFDNLRIGLNGDFTQPRYTRFADLSVPGGSRVGEPLAYIPDYRVSGSIENRFAMGGEMALTPRIQVTRTGERYLFTDSFALSREAGRVPPVTTADASLKLEVHEKLSFDLYGKNIFNKKYANDALSFRFVVFKWYAPPVTYGLTARYKF